MSGINGYALKKDSIYKLVNGDRIELLLKQHIFKIVFKPPIILNSSPKPTTPVAKTASIFEKPSKRLCQDFNWDRLHDGKLHTFQSRDVKWSPKVAGFDLDGTLITTKSGLVFAKDINDWKLWHADVPNKLRSLHKEGYQITIFTNQAGISKGKLKIEDFRSKFERIVEKIGIPLRGFISTGQGEYRKPMIGMWNELIKNETVDLSESFYCGDAAGRPATKKTKKDFSNSDRFFAQNIGIKFYTPEELFLKQNCGEFAEPEFDPKSLEKLPLTIPKTELVSKNQEVLLLVGYPASGKSSICKEHLIPNRYTWVNRDTLQTAAKCLSAAEVGLKDGHSVVIDNTNMDAKSREPYIQLAKKFKVPIRCGVMNVTTQQCFHNNTFREMTDSKHAIITPQVMNALKYVLGF